MAPKELKKEELNEDKRTLEKIIEISFIVDCSFSDFELVLRVIPVLKEVLKRAEIYKEELSYGSSSYGQYVAVFGRYKFSVMFYRGIKEENGKYLQLDKVKKIIKKDSGKVVKKVEEHYKPAILQSNFICLYKENGIVKMDLILDENKDSYVLGSEVDLRVTVEALPAAIKGILYKLSGEDNDLLDKLVSNEQEKNAIRSFLEKKYYFKIF